MGLVIISKISHLRFWITQYTKTKGVDIPTFKLFFDQIESNKATIATKIHKYLLPGGESKRCRTLNLFKTLQLVQLFKPTAYRRIQMLIGRYVRKT